MLDLGWLASEAGLSVHGYYNAWGARGGELDERLEGERGEGRGGGGVGGKGRGGKHCACALVRDWRFVI